MSAHKIGDWSVNLNERTGRDSDEIPITDASGGVVAAVWQMGEDFDGDNGDANAKAHASRIVACVNACEGISPQGIQDAIEALKAIEPLLKAAVRYGIVPPSTAQQVRDALAYVGVQP